MLFWARGNGFGPFCHMMLRLVKGTKKKLNKYDLTTMKNVTNIIWLLFHVFDWPAIIIIECEKYISR
jgi:hypothetical protein